ncbi:MAG: sugar phosphate isomerase/epimerase [Acidobacteriaceae bacterium]|nr:sugar phosphate isomerase/epimerase [Acidobacteriaceae bacterium]
MPIQLTRRSLVGMLGAVPLLKGGPPGGRMFLALNSTLVNNKVPWPDFARLAAKTGFPGTDVMLDAAQKAGVTATNDLLAELRVKPAVLGFPVEFRKDNEAFVAGYKKLGESARFAAAIHCPRMMTYIMPSADVPKAELYPVYRSRFSQCARVLADSGVRLGLEFLGPLHLRKAKPYEFIWKMPDMLEFARDCGPNVGLLLDSWHWHHAGATTTDILAAGRERIVHVHFNDAPALPPEQIRDDHRLLPGEGVINLVGFLRALQKVGYTDALSVEVFNRLNDLPPEEAARKALNASLGVFRKAAVPEG